MLNIGDSPTKYQATVKAGSSHPSAVESGDGSEIGRAWGSARLEP